MRDFLEDLEAKRGDAYRAAQKLVQQDLPRRFYKTAGVAEVEGGFAVTLDGRATRTPGRVPVRVPAAAIATRMAEEWASQGDHLDPARMPLIRLVNSTIESGEDRIPGLRDEIVKYAATDLLLYRADGPESLVAAQERHWDEALVRLARHFGVSFRPTMGIAHQPQPEATLARLAETLGEEGLFVAAALNSITTLTGSGLLAIALRHGLLSADEVWTDAHVDEDHQIGFWGEVEEARERRQRRRDEFDAAAFVIETLKA